MEKKRLSTLKVALGEGLAPLSPPVFTARVTGASGLDPQKQEARASPSRLLQRHPVASARNITRAHGDSVKQLFVFRR